MKVMHCPLVHGAVSLNVPSEKPFVTPAPAAHSTAFRYAGVIESANGLFEYFGLGCLLYRQMKVHICPRVQVLSTPKDPSPKPFVIPL
jgi:hypothetical protein